jgi:hypothetical protein
LMPSSPVSEDRDSILTHIHKISKS